jgi:hypothetical protein
LRANPFASACVVVFLACGFARAQDAQHGDAASASEAPVAPTLSISLLTIGPGAIFFERFGHNAIVVRDAQQGTAIAYNYGIFDFGEDDFLVNFARGRMMYRIVADDLDDDLDMYREEGRGIDEQQLALTPDQARELARSSNGTRGPRTRATATTTSPRTAPRACATRSTARLAARCTRRPKAVRAATRIASMRCA